MKKRKGLRRLVLPISLIGLGIIIGASMFNSSRPSIQVHGDIGYTVPPIDLGESVDLNELEIELNEMMNELESELEISIPNIPKIQTSPQQSTIIIEGGENRSPSSQVNVGRISAFMGMFGIAAIFLMAMMTFLNNMRSPRRTA